MNWVDTPESSSIARFGYDDGANILVVEFKKGYAYNYFDVAADVFEQMKSAASKGQFLTDRIKGVYRYARL
jgi:hypothetical protein